MRVDDQKLLWAKTGASGGEKLVHPLLCHLLDVAAVTCVLWDSVLGGRLRDDLIAPFELSSTDAGRRFAFWAGLHDIGKATPGFQALHEPSRTRLLEAGFKFPKRRGCQRHGTLTVTALHQIYLDDATQDAALGLIAAVASHHGDFPPAGDVNRTGSERHLGDARWQTARRTLIGHLADVLEVAEPVPPTLSSRDHRFFMFLAGLTSVADWIGSAERWFPFEPYPDDPHAYFDAAREKATRAIDEIGWARWRPSEEPISFTDFFGFEAPNAMQERVIALPSQSDGGELVIIEAPMGEGKTEAALYLVDRWNRTKAERGCYVAMPTQATANAMFDRFHDDYLANRYPDQYVDLQLVHGHAALSEAYQQLRGLGQIWDQDDVDDSAGGAVVAGEWFGYRKRGLLGPFGVGTVDQALLSAMQASHSFVRLFGLAGKAVIFDEVHAFDTYTSDLLDRLLQWLGAMGCPVILLSATLPPSRRRKLLEAYAGDVEVPEVPYPRVLRVSSDGVDAATWDTPRKRVELGRVNPDPAALAGTLDEALRDGGSAAVICNTVAAAQNTFLALDELLPDAIERDLFHARFPFDERDAREKLAIKRFGKGDANRPERAVLVATQVIEQSLDLDFDLMISEMAPVDLLLQRSGRMHRHQRERPDGLTEPCLLLMEPHTAENGVPDFGNSRYIYGDHLLLKTWLALRDRDHFLIPDDVEDLICAVYEDEPVVSDAALVDALAEAAREAEQRRRRLQHEAALRQLAPPDLEEDFWVLPGDLSLEEDNPRIHKYYRALTRWQDRPSVEVVCLEMVDGQPHVRSEDGAGPVALDAPPSDDLAEKLLRRSVRLSGHAACELLTHDGPRGWRKNSLLRYHRAAVFDEEGRFVGDAFELRLDSQLGIRNVRDDEGAD